MQIKKPTKVQPLFNKLITTMDVYEDDVTIGNIIQKTKGNLKEYQTVVAAGTMVRDIKVGDIVAINLKQYAKMKHKNNSLAEDIIGDNPVLSYNPPIILVDDKPHLMLEDRDIDYIVTEFKEEDAGSNILHQTTPTIEI